MTKLPKKPTKKPTKKSASTNIDNEFKIDESMEIVNVEFISKDEVTIVPDEHGLSVLKDIPKKIEIVEHEELSKPIQNNNWTWTEYLLLSLVCGLFYVLGIATAFLY